MEQGRLHIAIPLMDELENLPQLLSDIRIQDHDNYKLYVCVNQPDTWWDHKEKHQSCERNLQSIDYLNTHADFPIKVIDRSSRGKGWKGKNLGVGWARKVVMDAVMEEASDEDILITLDGDTRFRRGYFSSISRNFSQHPDAVGLSVPYYHKLSGSEAEDRAILRYEIYMRNYAINLWRIGNPYHFTALGSAMALPIKSYNAIRGMTPKKSGEDFYFLQKLVKYGRLLTWNEEKVFPAARFSDRVFFGTGPAMIKGDRGDWESYPVYHYRLFDEVKKTYDAFPKLFEEEVITPLGEFLMETLRQENIWQPLRINASSVQGFVKACTEKIDGLRILQFLKYSQEQKGYRDEDCLISYFKTFRPDLLDDFDFLPEGFNFEILSVEQLNSIRNALVSIEEGYQLANHE